MSEQLHEQISAFVDGELAEHETELLLRRLERDPELQRAYARYVAMGASLRREPLGTRSSNLVQRVRAAVAQESAQHGKRGGAMFNRRWMRPLAGAAIAATVATVAILGVQRLQSTGDTGAQQVAAVPVTTTPIIGSVESTEPPSYTVPEFNPERRGVPAARLTNYVLAHSEYSSVGPRNVLSGVIAEDPTPIEEPDSTESTAAPQP